MVIVLLRLILFALVAYAVSLFARFFFGLKRGGPQARPQEPRQVRGLMVKDEVCGTYVPREEALTEVRGGVEHYFCSEECRRKLKSG